jgi:hypothetical protein
MFYLKLNIDILGQKHSVVFVMRTKRRLELNVNIFQHIEVFYFSLYSFVITDCGHACNSVPKIKRNNEIVFFFRDTSRWR